MAREVKLEEDDLMVCSCGNIFIRHQYDNRCGSCIKWDNFMKGLSKN